MPPLWMVGYGIVWLILAGYFVWLCSEMSGQTVSGGGSIAAIFGAVAVGVVVGFLGMRFGDARREH